jgi:hypothetical protein
MLEPTIVESPLIQINSEQVKQSLIEVARQLRCTLVDRLVSIYRQECQRLINNDR